MDQELQGIESAKKTLSSDEKIQFDMQFASRRKNPTTAFLLSLFFGTWGVDRFYIGQTGLGFLKLFTLGGLLVWTVVDWFIIMRATRRLNGGLAGQIRASLLRTRPAPAAAEEPVEEKRSIAHEGEPPGDTGRDSLKAS